MIYDEKENNYYLVLLLEHSLYYHYD